MTIAAKYDIPKCGDRSPIRSLCNDTWFILCFCHRVMVAAPLHFCALGAAAEITRPTQNSFGIIKLKVAVEILNKLSTPAK